MPVKANNRANKPEKVSNRRHPLRFNGARLKQERDDHGLAQEDLQARMRMGKSVQMSRWESGSSDPSLYWLVELCRYFNRPPSYFLQIEERYSDNRTQMNELSAKERRLVEHVRGGEVLDAMNLILQEARQLMKDDPDIAVLFRENKLE